MTSDADPCPGAGRCHGCLKWCNTCGDVSDVCDFAGCDAHPRPSPDELAAAREQRITWLASRLYTTLDGEAPDEFAEAVIRTLSRPGRGDHVAELLSRLMVLASPHSSAEPCWHASVHAAGGTPGPCRRNTQECVPSMARHGQASENKSSP